MSGPALDPARHEELVKAISEHVPAECMECVADALAPLLDRWRREDMAEARAEGARAAFDGHITPRMVARRAAPGGAS